MLRLLKILEIRREKLHPRNRQSINITLGISCISIVAYNSSFPSILETTWTNHYPALTYVDIKTNLLIIEKLKCVSEQLFWPLWPWAPLPFLPSMISSLVLEVAAGTTHMVQIGSSGLSVAMSAQKVRMLVQQAFSEMDCAARISQLQVIRISSSSAAQIFLVVIQARQLVHSIPLVNWHAVLFMVFRINSVPVTRPCRSRPIFGAHQGEYPPLSEKSFEHNGMTLHKLDKLPADIPRRHEWDVSIWNEAVARNSW